MHGQNYCSWHFGFFLVGVVGRLVWSILPYKPPTQAGLNIAQQFSGLAEQKAPPKNVVHRNNRMCVIMRLAISLYDFQLKRKTWYQSAVSTHSRPQIRLSVVTDGAMARRKDSSNTSFDWLDSCTKNVTHAFHVRFPPKNIRDLTQNTKTTATRTSPNKRLWWAEQWLCTCFIINGTFLCRPLQNNNVKWPNSALSRIREPQRLIFSNI